MRIHPSGVRALRIVLPLALLLLAVGGCFNPFAPLIATSTGIYIPPPEPNSAENVIRLFEWCWKNRDITRYQELFTADFRFQFALGDSAGNLFRDRPVDRDEELTIARNLFVGGGAEPAATNISLTMDPTLVPMPDSRPGKNPKWHKEIVTGVDLYIKTDTQEYRIMGSARFFVVRGDSAAIPTDLGFKSDSTRWYIDQWNDETLTSPGGTALASARTAGTVRGGPAVLVTVLPADRSPRVPGERRAPAAYGAPTPAIQITWGQLFAFYSD